MGKSWAVWMLAGGAALVGSGASAAGESQGLLVYGSQKFWSATFEASSIDVQTVIPPGTAAPVLKTSFAPYRASDILSITTLGVRLGKASVFASVMPKVSSTVGNALVSGSVSRSERDIGASYQVGPGLAVSLVWKVGKASPLVTPAASALLNARGSQTGSGYLLGLSGTATLDERMSLYGNLGYGPVRWKNTEVFGPLSRNRGRYTLGEVGLAFQLLEPGDLKFVSNASLQLGYRIQLASYDDVDLPTFRPDGSVASTERTPARAVTQGLALGLSVVF